MMRTGYCNLHIPGRSTEPFHLEGEEDCVHSVQIAGASQQISIQKQDPSTCTVTISSYHVQQS
eukprot:756505-Amphidinium_carterae.1